MPPGRAPGRVLICEDSAILCQLLEDALRAHGVAGEVDKLHNGADLLSTFRLYAQAGDPPSLVILDVELPGGPDGLLVGRTLRALEKQLGAAQPVPILFFSSHPTSHAIEQAVKDCFPARYAQKREGGGPAGVAYEGAVLMRSMFVSPGA